MATVRLFYAEGERSTSQVSSHIAVFGKELNMPSRHVRLSNGQQVNACWATTAQEVNSLFSLAQLPLNPPLADHPRTVYTRQEQHQHKSCSVILTIQHFINNMLLYVTTHYFIEQRGSSYFLIIFTQFNEDEYVQKIGYLKRQTANVNYYI